jgi:hypothetical protein
LLYLLMSATFSNGCSLPFITSDIQLCSIQFAVKLT